VSSGRKEVCYMCTTITGIYTNFWTMVATWSPNFHFQGAQQII
jgi:hypothetical protein